MSPLSIALLSTLYLAVGILAARIRAERQFDPENLGNTTDGYGKRVPRTLSGAEDFWLGTGVAFILFWPFIAVGLVLAGFILGVCLIFRRALLPSQLRRMLGDRPS